MNRLSLLLAWRYLRGTAYDNNVSTMVRICFVSILIGSFALALVNAVKNGYEQAIYKKMQGIHAQIIMRAHGKQLNIDAINDLLTQQFPQVAAISGTANQYALVQSNGNTHVIMLRGIDPVQEARVSTIEEKIIQPQDNTPHSKMHISLHASAKTHISLQASIKKNRILIGESLAKDLGVTYGDTIQIMYSEDNQPSSRKITMESVDVVIGGMFKTGIDEFDYGVTFCSLDFLQNLFPENGITQINLLLTPDAQEKETIEALQKTFNIEVFSWQDLYPALLSALKLEKYALILILLLITMVASMNIIALLFMQITQKRPDIAILYAMGMQPTQIVSIFMLMGMNIAGIASLSGIFLAWIASILLERYPFIELPDVYYVSHLPAKMDWTLACTVFAIIMLLNCIATWYTARRTKNINIADVLRYEG